MAKFTGLDDSVGRGVVDAMPFAEGQSFRNFVLIFATGAAMGLGMTTLASPAIMTGLAQYLSTVSGWPLEGVLLAQIPTWVFFPFPYQAPILIIGMAIAGVSFGRTVRLLSIFAAIGLCTILPLHFLWLQALGYIP